MSYIDEHRAWQQAAVRATDLKGKVSTRFGRCYMVVHVRTTHYALGFPGPGDPEGHQAAFEAFAKKYGNEAKYGLFLGIAVQQSTQN